MRQYYRTTNSELYHYGIKGMKWGIRRYQNPDGSLTEAGKRRVRKQESKAIYKQRKEDHKYRNTLTDEELNARINRLEREKRYSELSSRKKRNNEGSTISKAIKTAAGLTTTAVAVAGAAYVMKSGLMKMAVRKVTDKTIKAGRKTVDKMLVKHASNPVKLNKWKNVEKVGRIAAADLRAFDLDEVAKMIKLKKK